MKKKSFIESAPVYHSISYLLQHTQNICNKLKSKVFFLADQRKQTNSQFANFMFLWSLWNIGRLGVHNSFLDWPKDFFTLSQSPV